MRRFDTPDAVDDRARIAGLMLACVALTALGGGVLGTTERWGLFALIAAPAVAGCVMLLVGQVRRFEVNVFLLTFAASVAWYLGPLVLGALPGSPLTLPVDVRQTSRSLAVVSISLAPLVVAYWVFPRPVLRVDWDAIVEGRGLLTGVLTAFAVLQTILIWSGVWTYGAGREGGLVKSVLSVTTVASLFTGVASGALAGFYARRRGVFDALSMAMIGVTVICLLWALIAGRRPLAIATVLSMTAFFAVFWRGQSLRTRGLQGAAAGLLALVVIGAGWQTFFTIRLATYAVQQGAAMPNVADLFRRSQALDGVLARQGYRQNLSTRPMIIETVNAFGRTATGRLNGHAAANAVLTAAPEALFPGKPAWEARGSDTEALWTRKLGATRSDWSMTLLVEGYSDFGYAGLLIYLMLVQGLALLLRWAAFGDRTAEAMAALAILTQTLNVEISLSTYLATGRNVLLLMAGWWLLSRLVGRAWARPPVLPDRAAKAV